MTSQELAAAVGIVISLACSYLPGLKTKWDELPGDSKRAIMGGLMLIVGGVTFAAGCAGIGGVTCDQASAIGLARTVFAALVASQTAYAISPSTGSGSSVTAGAASASSR